MPDPSLRVATEMTSGYLNIAVTPQELKRYGGGARFATGAVIEIVFSLLLAAATTFRTAIFILGLPFGIAATWSGQSRDAHRVALGEAVLALWPQFVFGLIIFGAAARLAPSLILPGLPLTLGYLVAIPFAMFSSSAAFGTFMQKYRLCAIPEEFDTPREIAEFEARRRQ